MVAKPGRVAATAAAEPAEPSHGPATRPAPPSYLSKAEAEEWRAICTRMPAEWFTRETHALLASYCQSVITHRLLCAKVSELQANLEAKSFSFLDKLLATRAREGKTMLDMARTLRLTQQSRYMPNKAARLAANEGGSNTGTELWEE